MKRNNFWRWALVILVTAWSINSFYPPASENLISTFQARATGKDTNFNAIVTAARTLETNRPSRNFANLLDAAGSTPLSNYFPTIKVSGEKDANRAILNRLQRDGAGKIKLGLDLQGGTSFLVGVDTKRLDEGATNATATVEQKTAVLEQAIEVLRKRVDKFGVAEPILQPAGENRILIQLPGLSEADIEAAKVAIQKAAFLEFRMAHRDSSALLAQGLGAPGYEKLFIRKTGDHGQEQVQYYLIKKRTELGLTGKYVKSASVVRDPLTNEPQINFSLDSEGADKFAQITKAHVGETLAIVLDGELYSAANINEPITGGNVRITGKFDIKEALSIANALENPLEAPVKIIEQRGVDPSLGQDSIVSGIRASLIGIVAVAVFMTVYYMIAGFVACIALLLNVAVLIGVMCAVGTTFTLPGIAGIVLTVGMAVDANVLIYERIREELAAGKSLRGALAAGYNKAFGTIFDSHLTNLIASIILIFLGTGPVKGFGVALTIGVAASLFTALVVTRLIFDWLLERNLISTIKMLHLVKGNQIQFMNWAKPAFALSWALIIIGIGYGFYRGKGVMGVDFAGGDSLVLRYTEKVDVAQLRSTLKDVKLEDVNIQYQEDSASGRKSLEITSPFERGADVEKALKEKFPKSKFERVQLDRVGPVVGAEILRTAILSAFLAMFGILIYVAVRYEFSFAVGAVLGILHDVLMTLGCFFLSGRELSAPIVAAILTIIGFSINDTIVIFDRIREDLKLGVKGSFTELMNAALNQTLSRTIITSGTVFISTLSLYLFGGGVVNDFAFTFLVGIVTGTYSSIYIASALVLWWHKGERPKTAATRVTVDNSVAARV